MRSLRERLNALSAQKPEVAPQETPEKPPLFIRDRLAPEDSLCGLRETALSEIQACDPRFTGDAWDPTRLLFLDTETTGLSGGAGTLAFLVGVAFLTDDGLVVRQFVLRDYPQEQEMLSAVAALCEGRCALVTFNGKSFDIPLLESRSLLSGTRCRLSQMPHLDLLHVCRRIYRLRLPRCNLQTLEAAILDKRREDDLPGSEAPKRFFQYLQTGEFALLSGVLEHNYEDVVSLAQLTGHVAGIFRQTERIAYPEDLFSVGRVLEMGGRDEAARRVYRSVSGTAMGERATLRLAGSYKRSREWSEAMEVWRGMITRGQGGTLPYVELSKVCEHAQGDIPQALDMATQALSLALERQAFTGDDGEIASLRRRVERLRRRQRRKEEYR